MDKHPVAQGPTSMSHLALTPVRGSILTWVKVSRFQNAENRTRSTNNAELVGISLSQEQQKVETWPGSTNNSELKKHFIISEITNVLRTEQDPQLPRTLQGFPSLGDYLNTENWPQPTKNPDFSKVSQCKRRLMCRDLTRTHKQPRT